MKKRADGGKRDNQGRRPGCLPPKRPSRAVPEVWVDSRSLILGHPGKPVFGPPASGEPKTTISALPGGGKPLTGGQQQIAPSPLAELPPQGSPSGCRGSVKGRGGTLLLSHNWYTFRLPLTTYEGDHTKRLFWSKMHRYPPLQNPHNSLLLVQKDLLNAWEPEPKVVPEIA